jgi:vacuolar iron transporter family protein
MDKGEVLAKALGFQLNEITEHHIYNKLAAKTKDAHNKKILAKIAADEYEHYLFWKEITKKEVRPKQRLIWKYYLISKIFGLTFGIKLMEKGEENAQKTYEKMIHEIPKVKDIIKDENEHETELLKLIDEEKLQYVSSMVLGVNDALVELTGTLAGLTLALQNTRLIAVTGLITGIAASLSMAASEYLAKKSEDTGKSPFKASIYTGSVYIATVLFLIFPFLFFSNVFFSLGFSVINAIIVIFGFTFYISVVKGVSFRKRFFEMTAISLGVAAASFCLGYLVRIFLNVNI